MTSADTASLTTLRLSGRLRHGLVRLLVGVLVVSHAGLLLVHVLNGRLLEPATSLRWVLGLFLCAGFVAFRRLGVPVLWGRKALVLWLLVVLLHCQAAWGPSSSAASLPALPATLAQVVVVALGVVIAAVGSIRLVLAARAAARSALAGWRLALTPASIAGVLGFSPPFSPRPPPIG